MADIDPKLSIGICGVFIGLCGFIYGFWKDVKLRRIEKRANSPHFTPKKILLDIKLWSKPDGKPGYYLYNDKPSKLGKTLLSKEYGDDIIPDDYPDHMLAGLRMKNEGPRIRYFKMKRQNLILKKHEWDNDVYDLYYVFHRKDFGRRLRFKMWFETDKGNQGKQEWEFTVGKNEIRRIKPK